MKNFETTDFVQVEHSKLFESGELAIFWRNALYVGIQNNYHVVRYTDGTKAVLSEHCRIRKAVLQNEHT